VVFLERKLCMFHLNMHVPFKGTLIAKVQRVVDVLFLLDIGRERLSEVGVC
jgi:hypothetical protein